MLTAYLLVGGVALFGLVVIVVALFVGILLGTIDIFFNWLIDRLLLR